MKFFTGPEFLIAPKPNFANAATVATVTMFPITPTPAPTIPVAPSAFWPMSEPVTVCTPLATACAGDSADFANPSSGCPTSWTTWLIVSCNSAV